MLKMPITADSIEDVDEWRACFFSPSAPIDNDLGIALFEGMYKIHADLIGEEAKFFRITSKLIYNELFDVAEKWVFVKGMQSLGLVEYYVADKKRSYSEGNTLYEMYKGRGSYEFESWRKLFPVIEGWKKKTRMFASSLFRILKARSVKCLLVSPNSLTQKYSERYFGRASVTYSAMDISFFFRKPSGNPKHDKWVHNLSKSLVALLDEISKSRDMIPFGSDLEKDLEIALLQLYRKVSGGLSGARFLTGLLGKNIDVFTGTGGGVPTRVFSEAVREHGGTISGFPHGGGLAGLELSIMSFNEFATCDRFCCLSELEALDYKKYKLINPVEFFVERDLDASILEMGNAYDKPEQIDLSSIHNIMYINSGSYYDRFVESVVPDVIKLHAQFQLLDCFLSLGKNVIFKNRPKGKYLSGDFNHFGYYDGQIEYCDEPLTSVLDRANLFVLELLGSSALYEVMTLTDKPVILFVPEGYKMSDALRKSLSKRCYLFEQKEDEQHRLVPDLESLTKVLKH